MIDTYSDFSRSIDGIVRAHRAIVEADWVVLDDSWSCSVCYDVRKRWYEPLAPLRVPTIYRYVNIRCQRKYRDSCVGRIVKYALHVQVSHRIKGHIIRFILGIVHPEERVFYTATIFSIGQEITMKVLSLLTPIYFSLFSCWVHQKLKPMASRYVTLVWESHSLDPPIVIETWKWFTSLVFNIYGNSSSSLPIRIFPIQILVIDVQRELNTDLVLLKPIGVLTMTWHMVKVVCWQWSSWSQARAEQTAAMNAIEPYLGQRYRYTDDFHGSFV